MFGILLAIVGSGTLEISETIGKYEMERGKQSVVQTGFLAAIASCLFFLVTAALRQTWIFSFASLPTFVARFVLEIILSEVSLRAILRAERSTYGMIRVLTIPLLLAVDVMLGKTLSLVQLLGMGSIVVALLLLERNHGIKRDGALLVLATAVIAVVTISLYQYDITHFNSVEAEQGITLIGLVLYFGVRTWYETKKEPFSLYRHSWAIYQSVFAGIASVVQSFAYLFAPASVIVTAVRSASVLAALASGRIYFAEGKLGEKIVSAMIVVVGLVLLGWR